VELRIVDLRTGQEQEEKFHYKGGLIEFVKYIDSTRPRSCASGLRQRGGEGRRRKIGRGRDRVSVQRPVQRERFTYVNNINTLEGGTHLVGFRSALTRSLNSYASKNNLVKENSVQLSGDDFREGLTAVLSVKVQEPQFEGQTKTKLGNSEVKGIVEGYSDQLTIWLDENPVT